MAVPLNPPPASLGLASPELGPWFTTDITLVAPNADLSVSITFAGANNWLPPAGGILSLFISSATRPAGIAGLRDGAGNPAFANDKAIALFRLLPEVEERLATLQACRAAFPRPTARGSRRCRRARVCATLPSRWAIRHRPSRSLRRGSTLRPMVRPMRRKPTTWDWC